jgi:hypothetical protein
MMNTVINRQIKRDASHERFMPLQRPNKLPPFKFTSIVSPTQIEEAPTEGYKRPGIAAVHTQMFKSFIPRDTRGQKVVQVWTLKPTLNPKRWGNVASARIAESYLSRIHGQPIFQKYLLKQTPSSGYTLPFHRSLFRQAPLKVF